MFNRLSSLEVFNTKPQQIIRQFKLNHGLVLNGYEIMPSIQGVAVEDGELKLNLYKGQPLVYTCINSEENDLKIDTCINFPIAEIIYNVIKPTCSDSISNTSIGSNSQKIHRDSRDSRDSLIDTVEVELRICVMSTNYKNLKIDHTKGKKEVEYPLDTSITTEVVNDFSPK
ncbi:19956_t:CDS:2, partial [Rhizophagus irregularis]